MHLKPASLGNIPSRVGKMVVFFIEAIQTSTYSHSAIFSNPTFDYSLQLFLRAAVIEFGAAPCFSLIFTGIGFEDPYWLTGWARHLLHSLYKTHGH